MPNSDRPNEDSGPAPSSPQGAPARPVIYPSAELFAGGQEIWIEHGGDMYRLRITASGKLLLTK